MSESYRQLLDATIAHLETLKAEGVKLVPVSSRTLTDLTAPLVRPATRSNPGVGPVAAPARPLQVAPLIAPPAQAPAPAELPVPSPAVAVPASAALSPGEKEAAMADLRARAIVCQKCSHLASSRENVVFGVGSIHSPLMFVGEAPGADEDKEGEPFVGAAGQLLTRIIKTMGLSRETVYIANILKCRPDTPGQAYGNRKPNPDEMKTCLPYLLAQIDIIRPKVIVALGATAVEGLLGKTTGITRLRGNWLSFRDTPLMPTYHPAYLLRNQALSEKRRVWEDMLQVLERLGMPVSDKQRGYFLTA